MEGGGWDKDKNKRKYGKRYSCCILYNKTFFFVRTYTAMRTWRPSLLNAFINSCVYMESN